ncbi:MAG: flippase-like domain-containing protein [Candidatus Firestonebacteria bacterium]|nr:flippase-like domain-containing protein [Candidatus Firestonebacteria bacterium]
MSETAPGPQKHGLKIAVGILLSLVFLGLAFYNINFRQLLEIFRRLNPWWIVLVSLLSPWGWYFRARVWKQLIGQRAQPSMWNLFRIITIGYMLNNLLPLKIGEVVRAWLLGKRENLPTSLAIGTVVVERLLDVLTLLTYFAFTMIFIPFAPWLKLSGVVVGAIGLGMLVLVLITYRYGERFTVWLEKPFYRLPGNTGPWLHSQLAKFLEGLRLIDKPSQLFKAFFWCLITWMVWIVIGYMTFLAFGLNLPFLAAIFLMVVLNFGLMIPSSPGGLGVYEFMVILSLTPYGVGKEAALGVAFFSHIVPYLVNVVFGWIFAMQMNLSMGKMYSESEQLKVE